MTKLLIATTLVVCVLTGVAAPALCQSAPSLPSDFPAGTAMAGSPLPTALSFTVTNGVISIRASIGDGTLQAAVIATGLPQSIVAPDLVSKQSLQVSGTTDIPTLNGTIKMPKLAPTPLRIGRVVVTPVPFGICDLLPRLSSKAHTESPALWLGTSTLAAFVVVIDPGTQQVILDPPGTQPAPTAVKVPFELRNGRMVVQVRLNDSKSMEAVVDTTAVGTLIPSDVGKDLKLPAAALLTGAGPTGKQAAITAIKLSDLELGSLKVKDVEALYVSGGDAGDYATGAGVIGTDILLRYRVTIDYAQHIIAFEPMVRPAGPGSPPPAFHPGPVPRSPRS